MERILNMILRRLVNKGVNQGIKAASNRGNRNRDGDPEQRQQNRSGPKQAKGLRQMTRMLRRLNKF